MKTIGQFAKENDITVKTLHHYEKMELIKPFQVDDSTGYRYYVDSQKEDIKLILYLKQLGLSLSEIKSIIENELDIESFEKFLELKIQQSSKDKINAEKRYLKLSSIMNTLQNNEGIKDYKELLSMSENENNTGRHDRGTFNEKAEYMFDMAKENNEKLCVVEFDLDYFADINKKYGYEVGDIVIDRTQSEIAACVQESKHDVIFERIGGDEFQLIIKAGIAQTTIFVTSILNRVVAVDYSDVADDLKVSITAGIAKLSLKSVSYAEMVSKAAMQLYQNKLNKRK